MRIGAHAAGFLKWARYVARNGFPDAVYYFNGGLGDQLLCSAMARELQRRGSRKIWLMTQAAELFADNPDVRLALPFDIWLFPWLRLNGTAATQVFYQDLLSGEGRDAPLREHSIAALCRKVGIAGKVALRPYLPSAGPGRIPVPRSKPLVAVHSSCLSARFPIANKQWPIERLQKVVEVLSREVEFVQLGAASDPVLHGARDLRGKLTFVDAARVLRDCDLFVGLVGFLMHVARAVECPSVIVYGGRETPETTGYSCNINLTASPECSPCWYYSRCDHERKCLSAISVADVVDAVRRSLSAPASRPLGVDFAVID